MDAALRDQRRGAMRRFWAIVFLTATLFGSQDSALAAAFKTGSSLKSNCDDTIIDFSAGLCTGFIVGVADVMGDGNEINGFRACVPDNVIVNQVVNVARQYLARNPAQRHFSAASLVASALQEAFPCKQ
jgi:hypothetical protein